VRAGGKEKRTARWGLCQPLTGVPPPACTQTTASSGTSSSRPRAHRHRAAPRAPAAPPLPSAARRAHRGEKEGNVGEFRGGDLDATSRLERRLGSSPDGGPPRIRLSPTGEPRIRPSPTGAPPPTGEPPRFLPSSTACR
jgi:hypothetical protein